MTLPANLFSCPLTCELIQELATYDFVFRPGNAWLGRQDLSTLGEIVQTVDKDGRRIELAKVGPPQWKCGVYLHIIGINRSSYFVTDALAPAKGQAEALAQTLAETLTSAARDPRWRKHYLRSLIPND